MQAFPPACLRHLEPMDLHRFITELVSAVCERAALGKAKEETIYGVTEGYFLAVYFLIIIDIRLDIGM